MTPVSLTQHRIETARRIREHPRFERTPIVFVTGVRITELDKLRGYEVGASDYIPVDRNALG